MSKKPTKGAVTAATIEEQTAAFLKSGGAIQQVVKGRSGHVVPAVAKPVNPKKS